MTDRVCEYCGGLVRFSNRRERVECIDCGLVPMSIPPYDDPETTIHEIADAVVTLCDDENVTLAVRLFESRVVKLLRKGV